ncbi:hypothetical protein Tco_0351546 [Tanacetum coccineum]
MVESLESIFNKKVIRTREGISYHLLPSRIRHSQYPMILHILDTHFLRRLMNDGKLRGLELVKTESNRIITKIRQARTVVDNHNRSENHSHITHTSMSRTGVDSENNVKIGPNQSLDCNRDPDQRRVCSLFDNLNPDESSLNKIHMSMSRIGVVEVGRRHLEDH